MTRRYNLSHAVGQPMPEDWLDLPDSVVAAADYDALAAERDALRKDAERYRWLRDKKHPSLGLTRLVLNDTPHGMKFGKAKRRKRYLTDEELHAILAKCSPELSHAIRFLHYTALRTIDARRIRWSDWKADGLHVRISKTSSALILTRTPGLEGLMAMMRNRHIASLYVLAERNGSAWSYKRLYAEWQKVAPEDANLHDLRRKRLTDLTRERGVDFAQSLAAHSDPRMTQSYVSGEARVAI